MAEITLADRISMILLWRDELGKIQKQIEKDQGIALIPKLQLKRISKEIAELIEEL